MLLVLVTVLGVVSVVEEKKERSDGRKFLQPKKKFRVYPKL